MTYQEKQSLVMLMSNLLISAVYGILVYQRFLTAEPAPAAELAFWGKAFLIFIPIQIVPRIVVMIIFTIINKILTDEDDPAITDEYDKLVELKSVRNSNYLFMLGFFLAMGALALGAGSNILFIMLFAAMVGSGLFQEASQLYYYRRGV